MRKAKVRLRLRRSLDIQKMVEVRIMYFKIMQKRTI
nr:MAG TPA: hypothetical protein [Caudoviricetes sp.]